MTIDSKVLICRNENPLASDLDGEVIMLDPEAGKYYNLNRVGSFIWDVLKTPATLDDICCAIMSRFDIDEAVCKADVIEYIEQMSKYNLVVISE